jgi:hypothetical protein
MAIPTIPWAKVLAAFDGMIQANGVDTDFTLMDGATFRLKAVPRFSPTLDMTTGLQQEGRQVSVMSARWDAVSPGRPPQKGDQLAMLGKRFAIQDYDPVLADNRVIGYRIKLRS